MTASSPNHNAKKPAWVCQTCPIICRLCFSITMLMLTKNVKFAKIIMSIKDRYKYDEIAGYQLYDIMFLSHAEHERA